jgi:hypothetical protein
MARAKPHDTTRAMNSRLFWPRTVPVKAQYCRSRKQPEWTITVTRNWRWRSVNPRPASAFTRVRLTLSSVS